MISRTTILLSTTIPAALLATGGCGSTGDGPGNSGGALVCTTEGAATDATPSIWVVGDSTASIYTADLYPRTGWAQPMPESYTPACARVRDVALSGRSSKSYYDEGSWTGVRNTLKAGDFVLVQFGHNDEKADDPVRYTMPDTTFKEYLSKYIDESQAAGATPILLTPINRNKWSGGQLTNSHTTYPDAIRSLAAERGVGLVDATALTKEYFERIGQTATTALFMNLAAGESPNYPDGNADDTHLQETGARAVLRLTLADLARQKLPPGLLVKEVPQAP